MKHLTHNKKQKRLRAAFTLIELLVVIAIIGVLAGLLLPAITSALERSKRAACTSNLHQVGVAIHAFAQDHDGKLPPYAFNKDLSTALFGEPAQAWSDSPLTGQYLGNTASFAFTTQKSALICPSDKMPGNFNEPSPTPTRFRPSYGFNMRLFSVGDSYASGTTAATWWASVQSGTHLFDSPANTILAIDALLSSWHPGNGPTPPAYSIEEPSDGNWSAGTPGSNYNYVKRHLKKQGANILILDGHVTSSKTLTNDIADQKFLVSKI